MELRLDRGQVGKDVGVVELEIVQHRGAWPIVDEFRALVAKRSVVFVGLDDEERRRAQARRNAEVLRHAADQETGLEPGAVEDPRQHRAGRRLAVGTGHRQRPAPLQHVFGQPLRPARVRLARIEDGLEQRVAARHRVADHPQIRSAVELRGVPAVDQLDAQRAQLVAHRRVDMRVATADGVAGGLGQRGDAAHESAADSENMDFHRRRF